MPKKEEKERKKLVVEEVEAPVKSDIVSSTQLEKEVGEHSPEISEEAAKTEAPESTESPESSKEEIEKEIHKEESHLHDIHTSMAESEPANDKSGNPLWWILIPGIFLLGALLGGIVFYQRGISKGESVTPSPSPIGEVTATPSPTPLTAVELAKYPIKVQNGSGVAGVASVAKDLLTKAGFLVSGTGNASSYNHTDTVIEAKSDVPQAFIDQLSSTLSASYSLGTNVTLKDSSADEVIVIVGSSKAQ